MSHANSNSLYGLVLAGGHSTRMKKDKSLLSYHDKSQLEYCYELLWPLCTKVFISNRKNQGQLNAHKNFPQIHDTFVNIGPLGGILSAMERFPNVAWIILACDLPFVNSNTLKTLIQQRDPSKFATVYKSTNNHNCPEPLCAIYEPTIAPQLLKFFDQGLYCPRQILVQLGAHLIDQNHESMLDNVNDFSDYKKAITRIKGTRLE